QILVLPMNYAIFVVLKCSRSRFDTASNNFAADDRRLAAVGEGFQFTFDSILVLTAQQGFKNFIDLAPFQNAHLQPVFQVDKPIAEVISRLHQVNQWVANVPVPAGVLLQSDGFRNFAKYSDFALEYTVFIWLRTFMWFRTARGPGVFYESGQSGV